MDCWSMHLTKHLHMYLHETTNEVRFTQGHTKKILLHQAVKSTPISYILIILPVASILKIPESQAFPPQKEGDLRPKAITPGWNFFIFTSNLPRTPPKGPKETSVVEPSSATWLSHQRGQDPPLWCRSNIFHSSWKPQKGNQTLPCFHVDCFVTVSKNEREVSKLNLIFIVHWFLEEGT